MDEKDDLKKLQNVKPAVWDLGSVRELTKGGSGGEPEENIVWGTEPMVFIGDDDVK